MKKSAGDELVKVAQDAVVEIQHVATAAEREIERTVAPLRKTVAQRFPTLFLLLVTFGFTATTVGIEHFLIKYQLLAHNPEAIFLIGIGILIFTGTLYKKLG
jgi:hypothetical protein